MPWQYNQSKGWLDKDGVLVDRDCYSGNGIGFNNPSMESVEFVGPIPCGNWQFVGPPYEDPKLGPYVLKIVPADEETRAMVIQMGRDPDSFRLHGKPLPPEDINSGSDGCICAWKQSRQRVWQSADYYLKVVSGLEAQ